MSDYDDIIGDYNEKLSDMDDSLSELLEAAKTFIAIDTDKVPVLCADAAGGLEVALNKIDDALVLVREIHRHINSAWHRDTYAARLVFDAFPGTEDVTPADLGFITPL